MDSNQDSEQNTQDPMSKTKEKRDQFLVDIRKKKNQDAINQKRLKFSQADSNNSDNPFIIHNQAGIVNIPEQNTQHNHNLPKEVEVQLKRVYDTFCEAFNTENFEELLLAISSLRIATGIKNSYITSKTVIEMGIVPNILTLLGEKFSAISKLQSESAWLIANISAGDINDTIYLIEQNAIQILADCVKTKNQDLQENAMWALANIATEPFTDFRNPILDTGVLHEVVRQLCGTQKRPSYVKTSAWLIKCLLRLPSPDFDKVSISITSLTHLIVYPDEEIQKITLQGLYYFSCLKDNAKHYVLFAQKLIPKIVSFMDSQDFEMKFLALKAAGNLSTADSKITNELCKGGILQYLASCLESPEIEMRKEACFTLSNILADKPEGHDSVIDNKVLPVLLQLIQHDTQDIKFEGTVCIFNFVSKCSASEVQMLVSANILEILLQNLIEDHVKLLRASVNALYRIFTFGDALKESYQGVNPYVHRVNESNGVHLVENLQYKNDQLIYDKVSRLMDDFFHVENVS